MLIEIDDMVINTDQICHIKLNRFNHSIQVFFTGGDQVRIDFPSDEYADRFLTKIGRKDHFA